MLNFEVLEENCLDNVKRVVAAVFGLPIANDRLNISLSLIDKDNMVNWDLLSLEYAHTILNK
jgi:hypothetical protein